MKFLNLIRLTNLRAKTMAKSAEEIQKLLADPFEPHDIEWRVQQSGLSGKDKSKPWVMVIPYITNRAIQQRLDDVLGLGNWRNEYEKTDKGYLCGLSIRISDEWITKWDAAEYTSIEPLKGAISNSMKRVAVQFGMGRYLYSLETEFAQTQLCDNRFNCKGQFIRIPVNKGQKDGPKVNAEWFPPQLPNWALPSAKFDDYILALECAESIDELKTAYQEVYKAAAALNRIDIRDKATKIKDARKAEFEAKAQEQTIEHNKKFLSWLNADIKTQISQAPNESVLNLNYKKLLTTVEGQCKADKVCSKRFVEILNGAYNDAKNNLHIRA